MSRTKFPTVKGEIRLNEPLAGHTTFRTGGACSAWFEPHDENDLRKVLSYARNARKEILVMGKGSNVLFRDRRYNGIIIHLAAKNFKEISRKDSTIIVGAGVSLWRLVNTACLEGLGGIEGLTGIPGTVGGAIFMNAGYKSSISDRVTDLTVMNIKTGRVRHIKRNKLKLGYRSSNLNKYVILRAGLCLHKKNTKELLKKRQELLKEKRREQPLNKMSAGCVFKNPPGNIKAWEYIDKLGLRGKRIGEAQVSDKHANFIINLRQARSADILALIKLIRKRVKTAFGVDLVPEIKIL